MKNSNQEMNPLHDLDPKDAIDMLVADHKRVANLFAKFKQLTDEDPDDGKAAMVAKICRELTIHTQLEEELFYPAVRNAIDDVDQMDEAIVEHAGAKELIAQLEGADPEGDLYDAKVTVLGEQIDHHVEEEEGSMFPKARLSGLNTIELGAVMASRKAELLRVTGRTPLPKSSTLNDVAKEEDGARRAGKSSAKKNSSKKPTAKKKTDNNRNKSA